MRRSPTRLASVSIRPETSASGSSVNEEIACLASRGSATEAARLIISMPKPGIDGLDLVAEHPGETFHVAYGQRRTDAEGLNAVVDAMKDKVQAPGSKPLRLQRLAKLDDKLACVAGDCFSRRDRFSKGAANLYKVRRPHRIDRLTDPSQGLIEAAARFGTEAQGERRARRGRQFTDDCKTEDAKAVDHILRQAQSADRQIQDRFRALARWNDDGRTRGKTRQRMSGAPAAGEGGAGAMPAVAIRSTIPCSMASSPP